MSTILPIVEFGYTVAEHLTIVGELKIIRLKNH